MQLQTGYIIIKLTINTSKTKHVVFWKSRNLNQRKPTNDGAEKEQISAFRYLRLIIDSPLKLKHQINYVKEKALKFSTFFFNYYALLLWEQCFYEFLKFMSNRSTSWLNEF